VDKALKIKQKTLYFAEKYSSTDDGQEMIGALFCSRAPFLPDSASRPIRGGHPGSSLTLVRPIFYDGVGGPDHGREIVAAVIQNDACGLVLRKLLQRCSLYKCPHGGTALAVNKKAGNHTATR
jgi:hypothetical protein